MENGTIQEYDSPKNLLTDPNSHLSYLVSFLGKNEAQQLRDRLEL
jgi:ABC-type proline/glycine betaine transport system ATPase subunit